MILKKLSYSEFAGAPHSWSIEGLILDRINLLVGKNATGKTNTLEKIAWLGNMLAGIQPQLLISGNYDVEFIEDNDNYHYKLNISLQKVEYEELLINDEQIFLRKGDGKGQITTTQFSEKMNFQLSQNQLVVTAKRDTIQHPFLEKLVKWAEGQRMYAFSSDMGQDTVFITNDMNNIIVDPRNMLSVIGLYIKGAQEFPQEFKESVIELMKNIGYELSDIGVVQRPNYHALPHAGNNNGLVLYIGEKNSNIRILQQTMSQGMFRALSLIIQVTYNSLKKLSTTILIDDIGEGLDFERSSSIIRSIIDITEKVKGQVIMSTNDRFVMNNVPLEHWQVIQRTGGDCKVYNYRNRKEVFDEFAYTGLNNFDFLATDFINSKLENQ